MRYNVCDSIFEGFQQRNTLVQEVEEQLRFNYREEYIACAANANKTTRIATNHPMNVCHAITTFSIEPTVDTIRLTCTSQVGWNRHQSDAVVGTTRDQECRRRVELQTCGREAFVGFQDRQERL
jgi:hypothetical protein